MSNQEMPSIKSLFAESWTTLKASFGSIFLLSLLGSTIGFIFAIFSFVGIVGVSFIAAFSESAGDKAALLKQAQEFFTPTHLTQIGIGLLVVMVISWVISTVVRLAMINAIGKSSEKPSLGSSLTTGFSLLIQVMLIGSLVSLITFGSSFLLIIPAIIISLLFRFTSYEMVLGGKKWFAAVQGSVQIMSQKFGEVLLRIFVFLIGYYLVVYLPIALLKSLIALLTENAPGEALVLQFAVGMIQFVLSIVSGLYGIVYGVVTYQQAKAVTDDTIKPKLAWIWVVSFIGWIIAALIGFQLVKVYNSPLIQDKIKTAMGEVKAKTEIRKTDKEKIADWHAAMSPEVKALYDQSQELFNQMRTAQAENPKAVTKLADQNVALLKKAIALDDKNPTLWINLSSAYTWNTSTGTLQDALDASKKAEEADPSISYYAKNTAEMYVLNEQYDNAILKLQDLLRKDDNYGSAHILLGVAYKRTGIKDSAKTELQKGIDILTKYNDEGNFDQDILEAKKELETVDQEVLKTTSAAPVKAVASCISYQIREGEFASNKCYSKKDYDDLQYYLMQYDNAAMSYNGAASSSSITCNGSDFFKARCEENKETMASAQAKIDSYKATIKTIIARGK